MNNTYTSLPHRRYNILTGEWVLVSPHRNQRPWQGKQEDTIVVNSKNYDASCYLCPGNTRASGDVNPKYKNTFSFKNDFAALLDDTQIERVQDGLLYARTESGLCKVICFSPDHSLTLPLMAIEDIVKVVSLWQKEYTALGSTSNINYVQIFENKGATMGCSNPHPHGQIWSQYSIPEEVKKKTAFQKLHFNTHNKSLLSQYLEEELTKNERIVCQNAHFIALVPYWAIWPFEVMLFPKKQYQHISQLNAEEVTAYAEIIKEVTTRYDNLFKTSFPYSSGIHQAPTDGKNYPEWHFHMSFYPPLLRSATVKKFMVGYELFAMPQRDITAEQAAKALREVSRTHYTML